MATEKSTLSDPILQAIDEQIDAYTFCWLPRLAQELELPEPAVRRAVDDLAARGLVRWAKAGIWGLTDIERIPTGR